MTRSDDRALVESVRRSFESADRSAIDGALRAAFAPDAAVHLAHPFEDLDGPGGLFTEAYRPLCDAWPDLERRDWIVIAGDDPGGNAWVGCGGHYMGTFVDDWLGIPATGRVTAMRFHEFYRIESGPPGGPTGERRVVEMQALWDIPEVMMQADAWPMGPSLGRDLLVPGPATQDGLVPGDPERTEGSLDRVVEMLTDMGRHPREPVEAMRLEQHWHERFNWYGPAGIGTTRGVAGFRRDHQVPFLAAMPDRRGGYAGEGHFFAEGDYVGVTGWPGMAATVTGAGWLGIAPAGQEITMRSLDFWRVEDDRIRENWVLVDLLNVWSQLGVDVLARMREIISR